MKPYLALFMVIIGLQAHAGPINGYGSTSSPDEERIRFTTRSQSKSHDVPLERTEASDEITLTAISSSEDGCARELERLKSELRQSRRVILREEVCSTFGGSETSWRASIYVLK